MNKQKIMRAEKSGKAFVGNDSTRAATGVRMRYAGGRGRLSTSVPGPRIFHPASWLCLAICLFASRASLAAEPADAGIWVKENMPPLVELYRHLHQHPELSLKEKETAARMAKELREIGAKVTTEVGTHGVVGVLENGPGKVLMLRSDMDGLPVTEQTACRMRRRYTLKMRTALRWA